MVNVLKFVRNGGQMVVDVEDILAQMTTLIHENTTLSTMVEKQGAVIVSILDELGVVSRKLDSIQDEVTFSKQTTDEIKHTKFYGQTAKILDGAMDKASELTNIEIRALIHKAARAHSSGKRKGYTNIYNKLQEVAGFCVYDNGKIRLKKSDGIEGWKKDASYINAILKEGVQRETAVICMQILADR